MKRWLQKLLPGRATPRQGQAARPHNQLPLQDLEALENRLLPSGFTWKPGPLVRQEPAALLDQLGRPEVAYAPNGQVLSHVEVSAVFYGPAWNSTAGLEEVNLGSFLGRIVQSPYMDQLAEYGAQPFNAGPAGNSPGSGSTPASAIGRGTYVGADFSPTQFHGAPFQTLLTDDDIQNMLNGEIAAGNVAAPDANTLYIVYTDSNTAVVDKYGGWSTNNGEIAYHDHGVDFDGDSYAYAVVVDPSQNGGRWPKGAMPSLSKFQMATVMTSHELAEAVTDPVPPADNSQGKEIGDLAQDFASADGEAQMYLDNYNYIVQALWSQALYAPLYLPPDAVSEATTTLNGVNLAVVQTDTGVLEDTTDGSNWTTIDTGVTSFAVTNLSGVNFLFDLKSNGVLQRSDGTGWQFQAGEVRSFAATNLHDTNYLFWLDGYGNLYGTTDGFNGFAEDSGVKSMTATNLGGYNALIYLRSDGTLWDDLGAGPTMLDNSTTAFAVASNSRGENWLFDLESNGLLFSQTGFDDSNLYYADSGVTSLAVANLNGRDFIYTLKSNGDLQYTQDYDPANGWSGPLATDVKSLATTSLGGINYLLFLEKNGDLYSFNADAVDAPLDSGVTSFAVTNLNGVNYVFDLHSNGVVQATSTGHGWYYEDSGVSTLAATNLLGVNYVFELKSNGLVYDSDGYGWGWQDSSVTSLEVGTVNGINFVADLNTGGVLKDSDGTGWHTLRTNVVSFNFQFVNGADSLTGVYLLSSGSRWHPPRFGFFDYTTLE